MQCSIEQLLVEAVDPRTRLHHLDSLPVLKWWRKNATQKWTEEEIDLLIESATKRHDQESLEWLLGKFPLEEDRKRILNVFENLCTSGQKDTAVQFHAKHKIERNEIRSMKTLLHFVCCYGYFDVADWLLQIFDITRKDIKEIYELYDFLQEACGVSLRKESSLPAVLWTLSNFEWDRKEVLAAALRAVRSWHLDVANYLVRKFTIKVDDCHPSDVQDCFEECISLGNIESLEWLVVFGVDPQEQWPGLHISIYKRTVRKAFADGRVEMMKWAVSHMGMSFSDMVGKKQKRLKAACKNAPWEMIRFMIET